MMKMQKTKRIIISLLCLIAAVVLFYATKTANRDDGAHSSATTPSEKDYTSRSDGETIEAPSNKVFSFKFFERSSSNSTEADDKETSDFFVKDTTPSPFDEAALEEIDKLTKKIGTEGDLPDDIWILPRLVTENIMLQKDILENIIILGNKISDGSASRDERKMYYDLKIALLTNKRDALEEHHAGIQEQFTSGGLPEGEVDTLDEDIQHDNGAEAEKFDTQSEILKQYALKQYATIKKLIDDKIVEFNRSKENL